MDAKIKVIIADDHIFVRDGIKSLLENEKNIEVIDEASDGQEALDMVARTNADLLIIDIRMPHFTGIEVIEKLRKDNNSLKAIILSMHESEEYVLKSVQAGADGYLLKGSSKDEFLKAIQTVSTGGKYFSGDISSILINNLGSGNAKNNSEILEKKSLPSDITITKREKEIISLLLTGKGNAAIAEVLDISKRTAEVHRFNLMKKLGVKNLIELANKVNEYSLL
jgi:two-component system, NarL family, nitrate/nitrite response regulator NarL